MTTDKPLTAAERLRALITGQVERISDLEIVVDTLREKIDRLEAELAPFRELADEFAPEPEAESGNGTLDAAA